MPPRDPRLPARIRRIDSIRASPTLTLNDESSFHICVLSASFLTVTRRGEDRHVLTLTFCIYNVGHLTEEGDAHHLAHLATSLPQWLAQRIKERIRLGGRAQPGRRVAQPHAHVGLTEHIGDDR